MAELLSEVITQLGPRGLDFAKGSIDRAVLRNLVCLEVDLLKQRAGAKRDLEEILPSYVKLIRGKYQDLLEEMLVKYQGNQVQ